MFCGTSLVLLPGVTGVTLTIVDEVPTPPVVVITLSPELCNQSTAKKPQLIRHTGVHRKLAQVNHQV